MVSEIVFHLGDTKTGSTSIQRMLNRKAWTGGPRIFSYATTKSHDLARTLLRDTRPEARDRAWADLAQAMRRSDAQIGVVSSETFEFADPAEVARALDTHLAEWRGKMRFLSYVRPHAERVVSTYAEGCKIGRPMETPAAMQDWLMTHRRLIYTPRFADWRKTFGAAFTLRPMIRSELKDNDVVADFLDWLLPGQAVGITEEIAANEALSVAELAALRAFHGGIREAAQVSPDVHRVFGWQVSNRINKARAPGERPEKPRLYAALAERLVTDYRADAAALDAAFFDGTPMTDALLAAPGKALPAAQDTAAEAYFPDDFVRVLRALGRVVGEPLATDPARMQKLLRGDPAARKPGAAGGRRKGQGAGAKGAGAKGAGAKGSGAKGARAEGLRTSGAPPHAAPARLADPVRPPFAAAPAPESRARRIARTIGARLPQGLQMRLRPLVRGFFR
jgi:hypothetical protein